MLNRQIHERQELLVRLFALSSAETTETPIDVPGVSLQVMEHQKPIIEYIGLAKRTLVADQMGLGSMTACILAAKYHQADPLIIVSRAVMRADIANQVGKIFPDACFLQVNSVKYRGYESLSPQTVNVVTISPELLPYHYENLIKLNPKMIIFDERTIGNLKTQSFKAAAMLSRSVEYVVSKGMIRDEKDMRSRLFLLYYERPGTAFPEIQSLAVLSRVLQHPDFHRRLRERCYIGRTYRQVVGSLNG